MEKSLHIERVSFSATILNQLPSLVGDRSGNCTVEITRHYFRNQPLFVIAADDNFAAKGWPVCAVINNRWFRGAFVVLAERSRDPAATPLQGETFFDGLTAEECKEASSFIGAPPGAPWQSLLPRRNRVRY
jgi:hypothetical protein